MASLTLELSDQSADFIDEKVRSGEFRDRQEVVAAALIAFQDRIDAFNAETRIGLDAAIRGDTFEVSDVRAWLADRRNTRQAG